MTQGLFVIDLGILYLIKGSFYLCIYIASAFTSDLHVHPAVILYKFIVVPYWLSTLCTFHRSLLYKHTSTACYHYYYGYVKYKSSSCLSVHYIHVFQWCTLALELHPLCCLKAGNFQLNSNLYPIINFFKLRVLYMI